MLPPVARKMPVTRLKIVVLPDPFGPISPTISPSFIRKSKPWTACSPPNVFLSPVASSSAIAEAAERLCATDDRALLDDGFDQLEICSLHLVDVQRWRCDVALIVERDALAQNTLVVLGRAHGVSDQGPIRLADLFDCLEHDVGRFVGKRTVRAERSVFRLVGFHKLYRGRDFLHIRHKERDVVALSGTSRGLDIVDGLELPIGADHADIQADVRKLLRNQRSIGRPDTGVDRVDVLRHRTEDRTEILVAGADHVAKHRRAHRLRLLFGFVGGAARARCAVVNDRKLPRLELVNGEDRAGRTLKIIPSAQAVHDLEPAISDLWITAARRDHRDIRALEDFRYRNAGNAGDAPDGPHDPRVRRHLLAGGRADLRVALVVGIEDLDLHAEDATLLVPLLDRELDRVRNLLTLLREGACQGRTRRDLDDLLGLCRRSAEAGSTKSERTEDSRPLPKSTHCSTPSISRNQNAKPQRIRARGRPPCKSPTATTRPMP